jgi:hypothetical protein
MRRPVSTELPVWIVVAVVVVVLIAAVLFVVGRRPARAEDDEYKRQLTALELAWSRGIQAGQYLKSKDLPTDDAHCSRMYRGTVASKSEWDSNKDFVEAGRLVFVKGCDIKNRKDHKAPSDVLTTSGV